MVCAHCGSESHRTNSSNCPNYCTLCKQPGHRQKSASCEFRVCNKCGASGHTVSECTPCNECGSTTHKSALSFACPEHKCTNCEGTLEPKGHNRNDCPRMQTTMCEECGETGHSANKCSSFSTGGQHQIRRVEQLHRRSRLLAQLKRSRSISTRISQQLPPSPPVD